MSNTLYTILGCLAVAVGCAPSESDDVAKGCEGPLGPPLALSEINSMTACCTEQGGKAHCQDLGDTGIKDFLAACDSGGSCVPDSFLETGASVPPPTCTAFGGPGVCLSRCVPQVEENAGLLRQDTCPNPDDLCVPCISPLDNMPTGACRLLDEAKCVGDESAPSQPVASCDDPATCAYEASCPPIIDPTTLPACGDGAHCLDAALLDADQAAQLAPCMDGTTKCVPDAFLATGGNFVPATCASINAAEGRCLSRVLPDVKKQEEMLPTDTCAASERCVPCFDPFDGTATGACSVSCDTGPTKPATTLASCCDNRARCVPATSIPDDSEDQLSEQECETAQPGSLCVPNEILADGPFPTCTGNSFILGAYTGVCLSDCLSFGFQGVALTQGSCAANFTCAPCEQNGEPTGAPGCPAAP